MIARPGSSSSETKALICGLRPDVLFDHALLLQHFGGVLEALVLQQAVHQFLARILGSVALGFQGGIARQQHFGLDMDQGRRHVDELRAQIDIHFARFVHILQVLRGDGRDGDILDVDLLLADQIQQQV